MRNALLQAAQSGPDLKHLLPAIKLEPGASLETQRTNQHIDCLDFPAQVLALAENGQSLSVVPDVVQRAARLCEYPGALAQVPKTRVLTERLLALYGLYP